MQRHLPELNLPDFIRDEPESRRAFSAFFSAIAAGCRPGDFTHLAILGDTDQAIAPCGACRQVMVELGGPHSIGVQANLHGCVEITTAGKLLPGAVVLDRMLGD